MVFAEFAGENDMKGKSCSTDKCQHIPFVQGRCICHGEQIEAGRSSSHSDDAVGAWLNFQQSKGQ
ncbi:Uncharacterised protein [Mycobacteroides abscessus subsp. abscessus]|nr:Uncharacterised protein [Mycobacteroides abscessus subsp. abscessus]